MTLARMEGDSRPSASALHCQSDEASGSRHIGSLQGLMSRAVDATSLMAPGGLFP
jgi:hypothetical protein